MPEPIHQSVLRKIQDELNRVFSANIAGMYGAEAARYDQWSPSVDIYEGRDAIVIEVELPGLSREDIEVTLETGILTLRGERPFEKSIERKTYHRVERPYGSFSRSFILPAGVVGDAATAEYVNGILRITLPRLIAKDAQSIQVGLSPERLSGDVHTADPEGGHPDIVLGLIEEILTEQLGSDDGDSREWHGGELEEDLNERLSTAESSPLFVNMWITDAEGKMLPEPISLSVDSDYQFLFAVERWPRTDNSELFVEPEALDKALERSPTVEIVLEVACPFLECDGRAGYTRQVVRYRAGWGFDPVTFNLKPTAPGQYYLTACMLLGGEPLYNEVLTIGVSPAAEASAPAEDVDLTPASAS